MGFFFKDMDPPSGCQMCRFAPIFCSPSAEGGYVKEQICLVKNETVQRCTTEDADGYPESWWDEKHLDCPGVTAQIAGEEDVENETDEKEENTDSV